MPNYQASVEDFAALRASMDDPFGDPAACLASAGLDERSYTELTGAWRARLARDGDAGRDLGRRFAVAYREARAARLARARGEEDAARPADPRFLNRDAQPWRAEAAQVAALPSSAPAPPERPAAPAQAAPLAPAHARRSEPAAETATAATIAAGSAGEPWETATLPVFSSEPSAPVLPFITAGAPRASPPPAGPGSPLAGLPFQPHPAAQAELSTRGQPAAPEHLASAASPQGASAPPRKRLMRFDPQTGQPLPYPVWVDVAPTAGEEKKR